MNGHGSNVKIVDPILRKLRYETGALIGFAGPRVIEQTVREKLPEGFQRSEFLMEKGAIDRIIDRRKLREELSAMLALLMAGDRPIPVTGEVVPN